MAQQQSRAPQYAGRPNGGPTSGGNPHWQHHGHYNHQVSSALDVSLRSSLAIPTRPSFHSLAGLTNRETRGPPAPSNLIQQQMSAERRQVKDYFRKLLANIEVGQPPSLNQEAAN